MIIYKDLTTIGKLLKPHGINGEIVALLSCDVDLSALSCIIIEIDGIYVPFFKNNVRKKGRDTDLITIDGITDERRASALCGRSFYALKNEIPAIESSGDGGLYANDLVGFSLIANKKFIGKICAIDDSTANCLFIIKKSDGKECLIPIADEFIEEIDVEKQHIEMTVPAELLEL